ncbi:MAG: DNA repair protein RadC [Kofleriaceae bacterium]
MLCWIFMHPRDQFWRCGPGTVSDETLFQILIGTRRWTPDLVATIGGLGNLARASPNELVKLVGRPAAEKLAAAFELGRRALDHENTSAELSCPEDVHRYVRTRVCNLHQELFIVLGLDARHRLVEVLEIARGQLSAVEVQPREVFRPLIRMSAAACVFVHNHPSGDPTPSLEDLELTTRLAQLGTMLGIRTLDHIVIAGSKWMSVDQWKGKRAAAALPS